MLLASTRTCVALLWGASLLFSEGSLSVPVWANTTFISTADPGTSASATAAAAAAQADVQTTTEETPKPTSADRSDGSTAAFSTAAFSNATTSSTDAVDAADAAAGASSPGAPRPASTGGGEARPSAATETEDPAGRRSALPPVAVLADGTSSPPGTSAASSAQATASLLPSLPPLSTVKPKVSSSSFSSSSSSFSSSSNISSSSNSISSSTSTSAGSPQPSDFSRTSASHLASTAGWRSASPPASWRSPSSPPVLSATKDSAPASGGAPTTNTSTTTPAGVWPLPQDLTEAASNQTTKPEGTRPPKGLATCSTRAVATNCLMAIATLAAVATAFMVATIVLCAKLSSRSYKYKVKVKKPSQETEMMCISSLLPEITYSYSRQRSPVANGVLVIPSGRDSDEDTEDNLTLRSFLPENEHVL